MTRDDRRARDGHAERAPGGATSRWEYVVALLGALLVVAALAVMGRSALRQRHETLPLVSVRADTVVAHAAGFVVRVRVRNDGGVAAAELLVRGVLRGHTGVVEESQATLDFVPAHSTRSAGLLFTRDPRAHRLELRAVGYREP